MYQYIVGIDVSKADFVVALHGSKEVRTYPNTPQGHQAFREDFQEKLETGLLVLENTGGYEYDLLSVLSGHFFAIHRASGRKIKNFIRSFGGYAKTDRMDALAIARYGYERQGSLDLYEAASDFLMLMQAFVMRRFDLVQMLISEKNRLQSPSNTRVSGNIQLHIDFITQEIQVLDQQIAVLKSEDALFLARETEIKEIPGIGSTIAPLLLTLLPELGSLNRRQIASLCGVAPYAKQSGRMRGYAATKGGRQHVRPLLFIAAMAAARTKGPLGQWYRKLLENGKRPMVALVALMRKIIVIASAKLRDLNSKMEHPMQNAKS